MRLSKQAWLDARLAWEADPRPGFDWLAAELGISRQSVSEMAKRKRWTKLSSMLSTQGGIPAKAKRRVGRPSAYRPEFCEMMVAFFDIPLEREVVVEVEDGQGGSIKETRMVANSFPTFTRFAARIGVSRESLRNWANAKKPDGTPIKPEFFCAYARARDLQEALLIEGGMSGVYNYKFAILAARNILGWRCHVEPDVDVSVNAATVDELNHIYEEGMRRAKEGRKKTMDSSIEL